VRPGAGRDEIDEDRPVTGAAEAERELRRALAAWDNPGSTAVLSRAITLAEAVRVLLAELQNDRDKRRERMRS